MPEKSPPKAPRKPSAKKQIAPPKPEFGSRVGNGADVLPDVDGRMLPARRYREICGALIADMGGDPSEAQTIIIRNSATLTMWCEQQVVELVSGRDFDIAAFTTATNALRRLLADIGLERKAKDITPTVGDYAWRTEHPEAE